MTNLQIIQGDCITALLDFESNHFDYILADPPYNHPNIRPISTKYSRDNKLIEFEGDNKTVGLRFWLFLWIAQCYRVLKPGELFCCFTDWRRIGEVQCAMEVANFKPLGCIVWDKGNSRPQLGRFKQSTEFVLYAVKGARTWTGKTKPGIFSYPNVAKTKRLHQVEKPVALIEDLLTFCPDGGKVLDPFCGGGTTGIACQNLGLDFVGVELSEHYADVARERLRVA